MRVEERNPIGDDQSDVAVAFGDSAEAASPLVEGVCQRLRGDDVRYIGIAPGRFDVMGGFADYSGALVLGAPLSEHACVGVQPRSDGVISVVYCDSDGRNGRGGIEAPLSRLRGRDADWISPDAAHDIVNAAHDQAELCALGTAIEAFRAGLFARHGRTGISISVSTTLDSVFGGGRCAAVAAATLTALAGLAGDGLDVQQAITICETVESQWLKTPVGPADAVIALLGEVGAISQFRCDVRTMGGSLRLPDGVRLIPVDIGPTTDDATAKYEHVRTTSFMGRLLIDRIVRHDGLLKEQWNGHLSRISETDFVEKFRDRLPTKLAGRDFLSRFGETGDPLTRIDPASVYRIRSRTEHHIYEHSRSRQFVEAISRATRTNERKALLDAGKIMLNSHWSCGQRCGLGSVSADALLKLLRDRGRPCGIHGLRISSRGCGGIVGVLCDDSAIALDALQSALEILARKSEYRPRVLTGSLPGAMTRGPVRV